MIQAIDKEGNSITPKIGLWGICPLCLLEVHTKYHATSGTMWWAHNPYNKCDIKMKLSDWEVSWINEFPKESQYKIYKDKDDKRRMADIMFNNNKIIQIQYGNLDFKKALEISHRYRNIVWLVYGKNLKIYPVNNKLNSWIPYILGEINTWTRLYYPIIIDRIKDCIVFDHLKKKNLCYVMTRQEIVEHLIKKNNGVAQIIS